VLGLLAAGGAQASILDPAPAERQQSGDGSVARNGAPSGEMGPAAGAGERIRALENEIRLLRDSLDQVEAKGQGRDSRISALNKRITKLEKRLLQLRGLSEEAVDKAREDLSPAPSETEPAPAEPAPEPYRQGFEAMKDGEYRTAIQRFQQFLREYPDDERRDEALFWLGESLYVKGEYADALRHYKDLTRQFPGSPMQAEALYKMSFAYYHLSDFRAARQTLLKVLDQTQDKVIQREARRLYRQVLQARRTQ
jgi:tol-pal system protein YbgF